MNHNSRKSNLIDYLIVFLLINISGNPVFSTLINKEILLIGVFILMLSIHLARYKTVLNAKLILVVLIYLSIITMQFFDFGFLSMETTAGFLLRIYIGYMCITIVDGFADKYVKSIYVISLLSLAIYLADQTCLYLGVPFRGVLSNFALIDTDSFNHIGIYNFFKGISSSRNSSLFWEPGAFAGYLCLALMFLYGNYKAYGLAKANRYFVVLILSLVTTMSTTGYLLIPLFMAIYFPMIFPKWVEYKLVLSISFCLIVPSFYIITQVFTDLDFMGDKIAHQYSSVQSGASGWEKTRFGAFLVDFEDIKQKPFFGWGLHSETRYKSKPWLEEFSIYHGNGLSSFTVKLGLVGILAYLTAIYGGFKNTFSSKKLAIYFTLLIVVILNGEAFLNYPLFLGLMFLKGNDKASD